MKTETELEYIRKIYLKDNIAVTKFIHWIKKRQSESSHLRNTVQRSIWIICGGGFRSFLDVSFPTISAYGEHGAMMHYEADENRLRPAEGGRYAAC